MRFNVNFQLDWFDTIVTDKYDSCQGNNLYSNKYGKGGFKINENPALGRKMIRYILLMTSSKNICSY